MSESQQARKIVLRFNSFFFHPPISGERTRPTGKRQRFKWMGVETVQRSLVGEPIETCFCRRKGLKMSDDGAHAPHQHRARRAGGEKWRGSARRAHAAHTHTHTPRADITDACRCSTDATQQMSAEPPELMRLSEQRLPATKSPCLSIVAANVSVKADRMFVCVCLFLLL